MAILDLMNCKPQTEKRMKRLGLAMSFVKAIFISHEHSDHITGVAGLSKKYQLPVYITHSTFLSSGLPVEKRLVYPFRAHETISVGALSITPFPKFHDASDPHSFIVSDNKINIGIFTDIGSPCEHVINHFKKCHAAFLEANYCEDMLMNGRYPQYLKNRISSKHGHLSNNQALSLFLKYRGKQLSHLILSHLSKNNNRPELVDKLFNEWAGSVKIIVASRYRETPVFCIGTTCTTDEKKYNLTAAAQLSLF